MILTDTSVWIDHLRVGEPALTNLLEEAQVCVHPMVVVELALGSIRNRGSVLSLLANLPVAAVATHLEVLQLVESHALFGTGLSLVDAHLLTGLRISGDTKLWTRDRRLRSTAKRLGVAADHGD